MSTHHILKCECGRIISQCRCMSPDKTVIISERPCPHVDVKKEN